MTHSLILGVDTSTLTASVAVARDGVALAVGQCRTSTHSDSLVLLIDKALRDAGVALDGLTAVALGAGPGSFTGLRIGWATGKGLAFAQGLPLLAASSLAVLAQDAATHGASGTCLAVLDARKQELYVGLFELVDGGVRSIVPETVLPPARLSAWIAERGASVSHVVGDGWEAAPDVLAAIGRESAGVARTPQAAALLALVHRAPQSPDALLGGAPTYIRQSEAELKWNERKLTL